MHERVQPVLNLYSCPRVASNQRINNAQLPLQKYIEPIESNECTKTYEKDFISSKYLNKISEGDGMIYDLKKMKEKIGESQRFRSKDFPGIKALICVCMYNEPGAAIQLTLEGIYENLRELHREGISSHDVAVVLIQDGILKLVKNRDTRKYENGKDSMIHFYRQLDQSQEKNKCDLQERIHLILDEIDYYKRKGMNDNVTRNRDFPPSIEKNIALVLQNHWTPSKTNINLQRDQQTINRLQGIQGAGFYLNLFSCFKHTNGTKLSSHLWFFEGFCRYLKPDYCVLLDVGTRPRKRGILNLLKGFSAGDDIGGVTGFMNVNSSFKSLEGEKNPNQEGDKNSNQAEEPNCCVKNFFSIERAQEYEYIIAHFLDKNAQSALSFLHVLPGAWSAYRYKALIKSQKFQLNLLQRSYFKMILNPDQKKDDFREANMYLAEDRILSLGIYCQTQSNFKLKYVPDAVAETDPMKNHENLMVQRRRWINSSLFAFLYVFKNYYFHVMESSHYCFYKYITLNISMFLALFSTITAYITPSIYFFITYSTIKQIGQLSDDRYNEDGTYRDDVTDTEILTAEISEWGAKILSLIYVLVFLGAVGGSLTGKQWCKKAHPISVVLSFYTFVLFALVIYNLIVIYLKIHEQELNLQDWTVMSIIVMICINIGLFVLILFLHMFTHAEFVCKLLLDTISYMTYTGAYAQTMVIHSFCNVDDVSWGTKGSTSSGANKFESDKVFFVSSWIFYNCLLAFIFIYVDVIVPSQNVHGGDGRQGGVVLIIIAVWATLTMLLKSLFAIYYHVKWMICEKCCLSLTNDDDRQRKDIVEAYWRRDVPDMIERMERRR